MDVSLNFDIDVAYFVTLFILIVRYIANRHHDKDNKK